MLFKIDWLVNVAKKQANIKLAIDTNSESTVREICGKYGIILFSITPFKETLENFAKSYAQFDFEKNTVIFYSQFEKTKELYDVLRELWITITYINTLSNKTPDAEINSLLEKLENEYKIAHAPKKEEEKSYISKFTDLVVEQDSKELEKVKAIATKTIEEANALLEQSSWEQHNSILLKVRNANDELKRLRLWTNITTLRDQINTLYDLMEKLELQHLESLKDDEIKILEWSVVSYLDLISEREKYRKTMTLQKAKASKWFWSYYIFFGTLWLYQKLLGKDIKWKLTNIVIIVDWIYNILIMFVMMTIIWLVLLQLFNSIAFKWSFFTSAFIDIWIMWVCSAILMKIKKPHIINLLITWPICILLYFLLHSIIYTNFWL